MLTDVVVQGLIVHGPEGTERAVVRINSTTGQLHFCPTQGITRAQVPEAHGPRVPKSIGIRVCHIDAILTLTYQHDPVYGYLHRVRSLGSFCPLLEFGAHLPVKFVGVATFEPQDFTVCCNTKDALLDHQAGVCPCHLNVGAVILSVYAGKVGWVDLVVMIGLETVEVHLVTNLTYHVDIVVGPLAWMRRHLFLGVGAFGIQIFTGRVR